MSKRQTLFLALVASTPLLALWTLHLFAPHAMVVSNNLHIYAVGWASLLATVAALILTIVGARRGDARSVLVGTAFSTMAGILMVHGLSTPGYIVGYTEVISFSAGATLPVGGVLLALTALPALQRRAHVRALLLLQLVLVLGVVALGVIGMQDPGIVPVSPPPGSSRALLILTVGVAFYAVLGLRALHTYRLTRRNADLSVAIGIAWLATALVAAVTLDVWSVGWWLGHGCEIAGIAFVAIPVALDLRRAVPSRPLSGGLEAAQLVRSEEEFLGAQVRALMVSLAEKDEYTEGHTRRVALRAVQVGEALGLGPGRLRDLATGGLLHDVGKLRVSDRVLKKPGPLDDEEFAEIRRHPEWGYRLLAGLGFPPIVQTLVLSHHERLDGRGYPHGTPAASLPLDVRILTVCDVYDALVTKRVYREAWTHERAIGLLREESGSAFDPACVAALERVLGSERPPLALAA